MSSMRFVLVLVVVLPLVPALVALAGRTRVTQAVTLSAGIATFALVLALVPHAGTRELSIGFLRADALSVVFLLATSFLYAATSAYSIGYLRGGEAAGDVRRYTRRFYLGFNLFA